MYAELTLKLI